MLRICCTGRPAFRQRRALCNTWTSYRKTAAVLACVEPPS